MKTKSKNIRKKSVAVLAGIAVVGAVGASAASLNGLDSDQLGADTGVVASCDTDGIDVAYTTMYSVDAEEYVVTSIDLSDINAACDEQAFDLTLLGDPVAPSTVKVQLLNKVGDIAQTGGKQSILVAASDALSAEAITGLALTISTAPVV